MRCYHCTKSIKPPYVGPMYRVLQNKTDIDRGVRWKETNFYGRLGVYISRNILQGNFRFVWKVVMEFLLMCFLGFIAGYVLYDILNRF